MKKSYKAPVSNVIEVETSNVIAESGFRTTLNCAVVSDGDNDANDYNENQFSASYRTNLWGDN